MVGLHLQHLLKQHQHPKRSPDGEIPWEAGHFGPRPRRGKDRNSREEMEKGPPVNYLRSALILPNAATVLNSTSASSSVLLTTHYSPHRKG